MKISIGMKLQKGPWGGGNQFGNALSDYLRQHGYEVIFNLGDADIDIILLTDPRIQLRSVTFTDKEIIRYRRKNPKAIVVHRVNECDERKGTKGVNAQLRKATLCSDHTVFVSAWLRDLHISKGMKPLEYSVIHNGSDTSIFNQQGYQHWDNNSPLHLVTHHWGGGWLKGFDIYQRLDEMLIDETFRDKYHFSYIGNLPNGFTFQNAEFITPLHGEELAQAIKQNHVYLTASQFEPGGNHQNEGACCGLPLLYRNSGSMPEYCDGFGIMYDSEDFLEKLEKMSNDYFIWVNRMGNYPHTAQKTCESYRVLFEDLYQQRKIILQRRSIKRDLQWQFENIRL